MLCLSGFELYSRWVPLLSRIRLNVLKFMNKNLYLWEFEKVC